MIIFILIALLFPLIVEAGNGCLFHQPDQKLLVQESLVSSPVVVADYFYLYLPAGRSYPLMQNKNRKEVFRRARHFMETGLGWKLPASSRRWNQPRIDVYFVAGPETFSGTTRMDPQLRIVFNERVLSRKDFPSLLIHQMAHAAQLEFRSGGDYWFYEATAGWMETLFDSGSRAVEEAQRFRQSHPELSMTSNDPQSALGVSQFLELISRTNRDVIRQIWQQYSYSQNETPLQVAERVLQLNHLPDLGSFLQNYFLSANPVRNPNPGADPLTVSAYSALVVTGTSEGRSSGGMVLSFEPEESARFSPALISYSEEESGTVSMKRGAAQKWTIQVPLAGMTRYKMIITNESSTEIKGRILSAYDASIPAVLEYFRANPEDGAVQLEWRTFAENGVAFWNLYRFHDGKKERLNAFPIPATIDSRDGISYIYVDTNSGDYYSLEAVTTEGFPAVIGSAVASQ